MQVSCNSRGWPGYARIQTYPHLIFIFPFAYFLEDCKAEITLQLQPHFGTTIILLSLLSPVNSMWMKDVKLINCSSGFFHWPHFLPRPNCWGNHCAPERHRVCWHLRYVDWRSEVVYLIYEPQGITIAIMNCSYLHYTTHTHSGSVTFGRVISPSSKPQWHIEFHGNKPSSRRK